MAKPTQFTIMRHGQVDGVAALYGKTNVPLSRHGWAQMHRQSAKLPSLDNIISSPLKRCSEFANQYANSTGLPVQIKSDMQECDFGEWDGVPFDDKSAQWPSLNEFWQDPLNNTAPQSESLTDFHKRVVKSWHALCAEHAHQNNLLICHGGVIRQILAHVLGTSWGCAYWYSQLQIGYASLTRITCDSYANATPKVVFIAPPVDYR
jgi:alpha-ribazole phosphatase